MDNSTVKEGKLSYLSKGNFAKKFKEYYVLLIGASMSGLGRLEFYEDGKCTRTTKHTFVLVSGEVVKIIQDEVFEPNEGRGFMVTTKKQQHYLLARDVTESTKWVKAIQETLFKSSSPPANAAPSSTDVEHNDIYESADKVCQAVGPGFLVQVDTETRARLRVEWTVRVVVEEGHISLFSTQGKVMVRWLIIHIRKFGFTEHEFYLEAGRKSESGPGVFTFSTTEGERITILLHREKKLMRHQLMMMPFNPGCKPVPPSHGPLSVPPSHGPKPVPPSHGPKPVPPSHGPKPVPPSHDPKPVPPRHGPKPVVPPRHSPLTVPPRHCPLPEPPSPGPKPVPPRHDPKTVPPSPSPKPVPLLRTTIPAPQPASLAAPEPFITEDIYDDVVFESSGEFSIGSGYLQGCSGPFPYLAPEMDGHSRPLRQEQAPDSRWSSDSLDSVSSLTTTKSHHNTQASESSISRKVKESQASLDSLVPFDAIYNDLIEVKHSWRTQYGHGSEDRTGRQGNYSSYDVTEQSTEHEAWQRLAFTPYGEEEEEEEPYSEEEEEEGAQIWDLDDLYRDPMG